ncbi:hypothetical protein, partial [Shewanella sp.]
QLPTALNGLQGQGYRKTASNKSGYRKSYSKKSSSAKGIGTTKTMVPTNMLPKRPVPKVR